MSLLRRFLFVFLLPLSLFASAHGYWIEVEGKQETNQAVTVKMYYGDYAMGEKLSGQTLDKMKDIRVTVLAPGGYKEDVAMTQKADYWEGSFIPKVLGRYIIIGVNDVRDVQDWTKHNLGITRPVQYLKTTYDIGKSPTETPSPLFLDLKVDASKKKGNYTLHLTKNGEPLAAQEVTLAPFGAAEQFLTADGKGKVAITLAKPGQYIISIDWIDKTPGEFKGKVYETVRHRLDYTLVYQ